MKITKFLILNGVSLGLCSCAMNPTINNRNYELPKNAPIGLAALSVKCNGSGMMNISVTHDRKSFMEDFMSPNVITVSCTDNITSHHLLNLTPGKYEISDISPPGEYAINFKPIKFSVFSGKVNYIGHLQIAVTPGENRAPGHSGYWILKNKAYDDVPVFQAKFPKISANSYKVFGK